MYENIIVDETSVYEIDEQCSKSRKQSAIKDDSDKEQVNKESKPQFFQGR